MAGGVGGENVGDAVPFVALGKPDSRRGHLKVAATEERPATVGGPYKVLESFYGEDLEDADFGDGWGQFGDVDADGGSLPFAAFDVELKIFAIENAQALADVA